MVTKANVAFLKLPEISNKVIFLVTSHFRNIYVEHSEKIEKIRMKKQIENIHKRTRKIKGNNCHISYASGGTIREATGYRSKTKVHCKACWNETLRKCGEGIIPSSFVKFVIQTQNLFGRFFVSRNFNKHPFRLINSTIT
jgi:hypothetical protein